MTATDRPHSFYLVLSHQRHYLLSHSFPSTLISLPSLLSPPKRPRFGHRGGGRGSWRRAGGPRAIAGARVGGGGSPPRARPPPARGPPPAHGWRGGGWPGRGTAGARAAQRPPATKGARGRRGGAPPATKGTGPPTPPTRFFYC